MMSKALTAKLAKRGMTGPGEKYGCQIPKQEPRQAGAWG